MAEKIWEYIANDILRQLKERRMNEKYLSQVYTNEEVAGFYNRRFDLGIPMRTVDGKWPALGVEDIRVDGKRKTVTIYKQGCGLDYYKITEIVKNAILLNLETPDKEKVRKAISFGLETPDVPKHYLEGGAGIEYEFSEPKPTWPR